MATLSSLVSAGGGSASFPTIFLRKSQTWVPPQDGNICIHVIGAGGSGGLGGWENAANMRGGGAGGYCKKNTLAVTTSGSFTVVIGSGGTPAFNNSGGATNTNIAGVDGGTSTVAGTGLSSTLTAEGGQRGGRAQYGAGSPASNGDLNYTGGNGQTYAGGGGVNLTNTGTAHNATNIAWNSGFYAGYPQVQGNFWDSKEGELMGGKGARGIWQQSSAFGSPATMPIDGEPLAGGGSVLYTQSMSQNGSVYGGDGGFGAGGGACTTKNGEQGVTGRGGEGIVVIQYIP